MSTTLSFAGAVAAIAGGLRANDPSHLLLNRAAGEVDQLGRRLHGLGLAGDREIADSLTAAMRALDAAHALDGAERAEAVSQAAAHLEAAGAHAGRTPPPSAG